MKSKYVVIFLLASCLYLPLLAQEKVLFKSINTVGLSDGEGGANFLMQSVNGLSLKKWFTGIGFGADYYGYTSYPLFLDARRHFGNRKGFAYADLGYNISGKNKPGKEVYYYNSYHFSSGVYSDIGVGYTIKFTKGSSFIFCAGYSYKEINNKVGITTECLVAPCPVDYSTYKYGNGRVVLKAGVDF